MTGSDTRTTPLNFPRNDVSRYGLLLLAVCLVGAMVRVGVIWRMAPELTQDREA